MSSQHNSHFVIGMFLSLNDRNIVDVVNIDIRRSAPLNLKWNGREGDPRKRGLFNHQALQYIGRDPRTGKYCCNGRNESKFATVDADTESVVQAIEAERRKLEENVPVFEMGTIELV